MSQEFQTALADLGDRLGLDLTLDQDGTVAIAADDIEIGMTLMPDSDEVHFHAIIGALPDEPGNAFHSVLLSANHMGAMTNGASIGYALEDALVTLNKRVPAGWITPERLESVIEQFADLVGIWQQNFTALEATAAEADAAAEGASAPKSAEAETWIRM